MILVTTPNYVMFRDFVEKYNLNLNRCRHLRIDKDLDGINTEIPIIAYAGINRNPDAQSILLKAKLLGFDIIYISDR